MTRAEIAAVTRLDLGEVLRSRWLPFCVGIYALLGIIFVFVGMRESSVLGFTGMGRVLFSLCHVLNTSGRSYRLRELDRATAANRGPG